MRAVACKLTGIIKLVCGRARGSAGLVFTNVIRAALCALAKQIVLILDLIGQGNLELVKNKHFHFKSCIKCNYYY